MTAHDKRFLNSGRGEFTSYLGAAFPDLIRGFYASVSGGARCWGDKHPHYAAPKYRGCLDMIAALYPEAKFIQIIRDGRGVVASLARKGWVDFHQANRIWVRFTTLGREFGRGRPSRYH